jgi:hypothetical protein
MKHNICEICGKSILTDEYHIISLLKGGEDKPHNKCELCSNCHRCVHTGDIILEGRFVTNECEFNETELIWRHNGEESINGTFGDANIYIIKRGKV